MNSSSPRRETVSCERRRSWRFDPQSPLRRVLFSLAAIGAYVFAFFPLYRLTGPGTAALVAAPVIAVAWLWGLRGGVIVGVLTFPLNTLLFNLVGLEGWDPIFRAGGGPGQVMLVLIGAGIGQLRDLGGRLTVEITARERTEDALRESEERFRGLFEEAPVAYHEIDCEGIVLRVNRAECTLLGYEAEEILGKYTWDFIALEEREPARQAFRRKIGGEQPLEIVHRTDIRRDGAPLTVEIHQSLIRDAKGAVTGMRTARVDITERERAEEQLVRNAFSDALTGLANRALLRDRLDRALKRQIRHPDYLFAVLFLDLDRFKLVNDSLGHTIGDELLRAVARRLEKCLRSQDTVARLGGDEFTMFLEDIRDETDATRVAERAHKDLRAPFQVAGHEVFTTSSIGIALSSTGYTQPEDLLRDADTAMYRAKSLGKACYSMFDTAMHERAVALLQLDHDLRRALERKEFRIHYQPIVRLENAEVTGLEALLRWEHPARGFVSPAEFIPLAEETRLIIPIGRWALEETCRQVRAWQLQFGTYLPVNVNLSGKQLSQPDLVCQITQILEQFFLDGRSLKLEITESVIMENIESVITMLQQLKALGIQSSMDDFGTGYSSFSYLHRLPIDVLKIDRSFVSGTRTGVENPEVVRTIITLARDLGIDAVAEGVETAEQLAQLRELGCRYGQGYLFSKPLDSEAAGKFIAGRLHQAAGV